MNPWDQTLIERGRALLRFCLWITVILNGSILAIFSVLFVFFLAWRGWGWLYRELFDHPW